MVASADALAQTCAPIEPQGVVVSSTPAAAFPALIATSSGLAVLWTSGASTFARALDPASLAARSAPVVLAESSSSTPARFAALADGTIVGASCRCNGQSVSCSSVAVGAGRAPGSFVSQAQQRCQASHFAVAPFGRSLATVVAFGPQRALHLVGVDPRPLPLPALRGYTVPELVALEGGGAAVVQLNAEAGAQVSLVNAQGALRSPVTLSPAGQHVVAPIRWATGLLTISSPRASGAAHEIVTMDARGVANGRSTRVALSLEAPGAGANQPGFDIVKAIAPASNGCFLVAWTQASQSVLFVGRVCNNALVRESVGAVRVSEMTSPTLASNGAQAYVAWAGDGRSRSSAIRVARLGCS